MKTRIPSSPLVFIDRFLLAAQEEGAGEFMLQMEMTFAHPLDTVRLSRSLELLTNRYPILHCRPHRRLFRPVWRPFPVLPKLRVVSSNTELEDDCRIPLLPFETPVLSACLLRNADSSRLVIRVSHLICDAAGVKEISTQLASTYNALKAEPNLPPAPALRGSRSEWQVLQHLPIRAHLESGLRMLRVIAAELRPRRPVTLHIPCTPKAPPVFCIRHLNASFTSQLTAFARSRGATLNDLFITAFYRALWQLKSDDTASDLRLQITVDLRPRYLPEKRTDNLCNLSSFEYPFLYRKPGATFEETLCRVTQKTSAIKEHFPGIGLYPMSIPAACLPYRWLRFVVRQLLTRRIFRDRIAPALTNMGPIPLTAVTFDQPATEAFLRLSPIQPPLFAVGLSGYAGSLTLSCGIPPESEPVISRFYDTLIMELHTGCGIQRPQ